MRRIENKLLTQSIGTRHPRSRKKRAPSGDGGYWHRRAQCDSRDRLRRNKTRWCPVHSGGADHRTSSEALSTIEQSADKDDAVGAHRLCLRRDGRQRGSHRMVTTGSWKHRFRTSKSRSPPPPLPGCTQRSSQVGYQADWLVSRVVFKCSAVLFFCVLSSDDRFCKGFRTLAQAPAHRPDRPASEPLHRRSQSTPSKPSNPFWIGALRSSVSQPWR